MTMAKRTHLSDREFVLLVLEAKCSLGKFEAVGRKLADPLVASILDGIRGRRQAERLATIRLNLASAEAGRRDSMPSPEAAARSEREVRAFWARYWTPERVEAHVAVFRTPEGQARLEHSALNRRLLGRLLEMQKRRDTSGLPSTARAA